MKEYFDSAQQPSKNKIRKYLSGNGLINIVKNFFTKVKDKRKGEIKIELSDGY